MDRLPRSFRRLLRVVGYGLAASLVLVLLATAAERVWWRGKVLPGVELIGASVSGKPAGGLGDVVDDVADRLEGEKLVATAGGVTLELDPREIDLRVDAPTTLGAVADAGRSGNLLGQVAGTVLRLVRPDEVEWDIDYDDTALDAVLDRWQEQVAQHAVDGTLRFAGARVIPVAPKPGQVLSRPAADAAVATALRAGHRSGVTLPVHTRRPTISRAEVARAADEARRLLGTPVVVNLDSVRVTLEPADVAAMLRPRAKAGDLELTIDDEVLREQLGPDAAELERDPEDARFAVEGADVRIVPHVTGRTLDLEQIGTAILSGTRTVAGELTESDPEKTTADLEKLEITELVSTFTSRYPAGQARVKNIHRASEIVDDTIVPAGASFSLNERLGKRTPDRGFVSAPVIYGGEFTEDFGGGVSQFATTFFNAVFFGGYPIDEYQAHTFYISRYPMGREATLSWPKPDLRFTNDGDAAILVRTSVSATSVTVNFYSTKTRTVRAEGPDVLSTIPIPEEFEPDATLARGEQKVKESGAEGRVVRVSRVIMRDGEEIGRKAYTTRYRPQKRLIAVHPCDHPEEDKRPPAEQCVEPTTTTTAPDEETTTTTAAPDD